MRTEGGAGGLPRPAVRVLAFEFAGEPFVAIVEEPCSAPDGVTRAEREIGAFLAEGLSNAEVARARGTSVRTVANQIAALMRKLGVGTRLEIALAFRHASDRT